MIVLGRFQAVGQVGGYLRQKLLMRKCWVDRSELVRSEMKWTEMVMKCDVKLEDWTWEM